MGADKKNIIPFLKKMLGSIPMMHIKIKNQNPFVSETSGKVFGCQGNVVEKTFRAGEMLPQALLEKSTLQHTYMESGDYVFMDMSS